MPKKAATPEPYWEGYPSLTRVTAFGNEPWALQLLVLNRLRHRSSDAVAIYLAALAIGLTLFASGVATLMDSSPLLVNSKRYILLFDLNAEDSARVMFNILVGLLSLGFVGFGILGVRVASGMREARVLLGAYESELERRYNARGRHARRWQESHSPNWGGEYEAKLLRKLLRGRRGKRTR